VDDDAQDDTDDGGDDDDAGGGGDDSGGLAATVADLHSKLDRLLGSDDSGDDDVNDDDKKKPPASSSSSDLESQVRAAVAKIGKEEATDKRLAAVEKKVERPPIKLGRLTRAIWGNVKEDA